MRFRKTYCLSLIFLLLSSLYLPACSITLQKQNPLDVSKNPFQVIQTFGFTELIEKNLKESPTQTVANLFAYYIDGRVLQNFVAAIFDRSQQNNLLSYQNLASILAEEGLTDLNTQRIVDLLELEDGSQIDFARFYTMSNVLFNEALTLVTYIYIMDKEQITNFNVGLDLQTVEHYILKIFHKLENIYPAPRCEDLEYLFHQSDKDEDGKLSVQEFHYLLSIFLKYYRTGIRNNEYAAIIFKDDMFGDYFEKAEEEAKEHLEQTNWTKGSFYTFLSMALHENLLNQVGHVLFNKFDTSGDGLISPEEFFSLLGMFGGTEEEVKLIFAATDSNSDGTIDFSEFLIALETLSRRLTATFGSEYFELSQQPVSLDNVWELLQGANPEDLKLISLAEVGGLYRAYDADKNGDLDEYEFRNFISELITYWKKKIDARDDKDMDEIVGMEPTEENIEQVNDDKQDESDHGGAGVDAGDIIDIVTEEEHTEVTEGPVSGGITESSVGTYEETEEPIGDSRTDLGGASETHEETGATESEPVSDRETTEASGYEPPVSSGEVTEDTGAHEETEGAGTEETEATGSEPPSSGEVTEETGATGFEPSASEAHGETESEPVSGGEVTESEPVSSGEVTEDSGAHEVTEGSEPVVSGSEEITEGIEATKSEAASSAQEETESDVTVHEEVTESKPVSSGEVTEDSEVYEETGVTGFEPTASEAHGETESESVSGGEVTESEPASSGAHEVTEETGATESGPVSGGEVTESEPASSGEVTEDSGAHEVTEGSEPAASGSVGEDITERIEDTRSEPASSAQEETESDVTVHGEVTESEPVSSGEVTEESGATETFEETEDFEPTGDEGTELNGATESEPVSGGEVTESEPASSGEVTEDSGAHEVTEGSEPAVSGSAGEDITERIEDTRSEAASSAQEETESDVTVHGEVTESEPVSSGEVTEESGAHEATEGSEPVASGSEEITEGIEATKSEAASSAQEETESDVTVHGEVTESEPAGEETTKSEPATGGEETKESDVTESDVSDKEEEPTKSAGLPAAGGEKTDSEPTKETDATESDASDKEEEPTKSPAPVTEKDETEPTKTEQPTPATPETPKAEEPSTTTPVTETPKAEEPSTTTPETPSTQEPSTTTPVTETPKAEEPVTTTPVTETPSTTPETPKSEEPVTTTPETPTKTEESTGTATITPVTPTTPTTQVPTTPVTPVKKVLNMQQADFNGDGLADFLRRPTSLLDKTNSQIFLSKGDGTFKIVKLTDTYTIPADMTDVYIGDFNGDGKTDLFRREKSLWALDNTNTAVIYFSNGDGTFKTVVLPEKWNLDDLNAELTFGDFDGDGKTDFIRQTKLSLSVQQATVYLSNGDGTFRTTTVGDKNYALPADVTNLIVGDFNGDGKSDFIRQEKGLWALDNKDSATLFTATGNGNFKTTALSSNFDLKGSNVKLYVADFNGDGKDDLLSQVYSGLSLTFSVNTPGLYISDGKGGFTFQSLKGTIPSVDKSTVYVGNFDGDLRADFLVQMDSTSASPQGYVYLTSQTSPSLGFSAYSINDFKIPGDQTNLFIGDFNGDGKSDFLRQETSLWALDNVNTANVFFSSCEAQKTVKSGNAKNVFKQVDLPQSYNIGGISANLVVTNKP